jgi:hypothetical protein
VGRGRNPATGGAGGGIQGPTHMFRKRAFTKAWQTGIDVRHASIAYGCNVDTLMKHYVALDEQQVTDDVFAKMNEKKVS